MERFGPLVSWQMEEDTTKLQVSMTWLEIHGHALLLHHLLVVPIILCKDPYNNQPCPTKGCTTGVLLSQIFVKTPAAEYICIKAASTYKGMFSHLEEQASLAFEASLDQTAPNNSTRQWRKLSTCSDGCKLGSLHF